MEPTVVAPPLPVAHPLAAVPASSSLPAPASAASPVASPAAVAAAARAPAAAGPAGGPVGPAAGPRRDPPGERVLGPRARPTLAASLRELAGHRDLLVQLAARDVRIRYKQAVMGFAWAVLTPLLIVGAGVLVRAAVAALSGVPLGRAELAGMVLKAFPWAFFASALQFGVQSVTANLTLVTKIYFPRAVLPIAVVGAHLFDLAVGAALLAVALPLLGAPLTWALLWVVPLVALLLALTAGLCAVLACANLFFRDVKYLVQVMVTFGIFFTPVLFDAPSFGPRGARLLMLNPLAPLFEGLRLAVVHGHDLLGPLVVAGARGGPPVLAWAPWYLAYSAAWAVGSLALGLLLFQRTQDLFAEFA